MSRPIRSIEEFYAHALTIEHEAAERYAEFARYFEDRDEEIAALCRKLSALEREHFEEIARACGRLQVPELGAHDYHWLGPGSPEVADRERFYEIAAPRQLLEIALRAEWAAHDFFVDVVRSSSSLPVRELASIMAAEETEHVRWVQDALAKVDLVA